ncbi:hypothetical protein SAMN02745866_03188 [Alteromonadaceae bacterium Bs31]|nr:hypothetical protein SAMN02745866_03188 [Alteromonadaceae bacterium Bs31]
MLLAAKYCGLRIHSMKTPKQKLLDHLECYGWDAVEIDEEELEWWADEIWLLKSHWSPNNLVAYITALVDPQHDGFRRKGQAVWAYGLSEEYPNDYLQAQVNGTLSLGKSFKNEIEEFVDKIIALREARNA